MSRLPVPRTLLVGIVGVAITSNAAAQNHPGELPIYGTYEGGLEQQRRDAEASAKVAAENQQMLDRLDETYAAYAPKSGAAVGGGGGNYLEQLKKKPLLPAARNPLIGRWQQTGARKPDIGYLREFPGVEIVDAAFGGACQSVFGKGMVAFAPKALNWVAPDGHEEILNNVEYRSDGNNIIMISSDPGTLPFIFGLVDRDHVVTAFWGCTMTRVSASAKPGAVATQTAAAPSAPAVPAPANPAILNMTVGETVNGALSAPPAGTRILLTSQDPDASLVKAGFAPGPGEAPIDRLFAACNLNQGGSQERCRQGMTALTVGTVGVVTTDMNGHAVTGEVAPGRYYLVGVTPYKRHTLIWHLPVDLKAGANSVTLSPDNGSISH